MLKILTRLVSLSLVFGASLPVRRMGYDVHITRAQDWTESAAHPITFDEWKAYIRSDREMRLDNRAQATTPSGETCTTEGPALAVWAAGKKDGECGPPDHLRRVERLHTLGSGNATRQSRSGNDDQRRDGYDGKSGACGVGGVEEGRGGRRPRLVLV